MITKNYKILIGIIIGIIISGGVAYAQVALGASSVSYNNSSSKLSSTTVQGAIDEIYNNAKGGNITYHNTNIVGAYMYDVEKCVTGDEETCKKTACPNDTSNNSCPAGTIIKYKVNGSTTKTFNVLYGDQSTITMQDSDNTVEDTAWYSGAKDNSKGPLTAIEAIESTTSGWNNVQTQTYTMGTTKFKMNAYTGCDRAGNCTENKYTWSERSAKARMITAQEVISTGCSDEKYSCPSWMGKSTYYWTMTAEPSSTDNALVLDLYYGFLSRYGSTGRSGDFNARAVVVISK